MRALTLSFFHILAMAARSQEKESFYVFDADWKPTRIQKAVFFLHVHQVSDTCWQWDIYNYMGPMLRSTQYRDMEGNERDGTSNHYDEKGRLDSVSSYRRGKEEGDFYRIYADSPHYRLKYRYRNDSLIEVLDMERRLKDSVTHYADEKESEYPGGLPAWSKYLLKNLQYPDRAATGKIDGDVRITFIVDKDGRVIDPVISTSVEYSLDAESIRIIRKSGNWIPAFLNGQHVKSFKMQPIQFRLSD